ncbi:claudin-1-like [Anguilla rostrata]
MTSSSIQLLGFGLAFIGFIGLIASTAMTEWKASSYAGDNIVTAQATYEGLWMSCVSQSTGHMQCKAFDSLLQQPMELQITRALMISSILLSGTAVLVAMVGLKCTTCLSEDQQQKARVSLVGGILFLIAGFCALVASSWYGQRITARFYQQYITSDVRFEFGKALFIAWGAAALSLLGGCCLCCKCSGACSGQSTRHPKLNSPARPGMDYV